MTIKIIAFEGKQHPFLEGWGSNQGKGIPPAQQMKGADQTGQAKHVVPVHVADAHRANAAEFDLIAAQLHLRSFPAVHQDKTPVAIHHLGRRIHGRPGSGSATPQNGYRQGHGGKGRPYRVSQQNCIFDP